jgi:hypothetical protein
VAFLTHTLDFLAVGEQFNDGIRQGLDVTQGH